MLGSRVGENVQSKINKLSIKAIYSLFSAMFIHQNNNLSNKKETKTNLEINHQ